MRSRADEDDSGRAPRRRHLSGEGCRQSSSSMERLAWADLWGSHEEMV